MSWKATKALVAERAEGCCEYCQLDLGNTGVAMHVDHILPDGGDDLSNLALSCANCNTSKSKVTVWRDPDTTEMAPLFNPRTQNWGEHSAWIDDYLRIMGLTATGRATVDRLKMNRKESLFARSVWRRADAHPPHKPLHTE